MTPDERKSLINGLVNMDEKCDIFMIYNGDNVSETVRDAMSKNLSLAVAHKYKAKNANKTGK
jgi:hypothetical protein